MPLCLTSPIVSHSFDTLLNTFFFSFSSSCRLSPLISLLLSISSYLYLLFYSTFPPLCLSPFYFPLYLSLSLSLSIPLSISLPLSLSPSPSLFSISLSISLCVSHFTAPALFYIFPPFLSSSHLTYDPSSPLYLLFYSSLINWSFLYLHLNLIL